MRLSQTGVRWLVLVASIVFVFAIFVVLGTHKGTKNAVITQTGGDYFPHSTWVVFYNADNLYGNLSNDDVEVLRTQLNSYLLKTYGAGNYKAQVVNDTLNVSATNPNGPPSFWFLLKVDGKPGTIRVNTDLSSGVAVFTLAPQPG